MTERGRCSRWRPLDLLDGTAVAALHAELGASTEAFLGELAGKLGGGPPPAIAQLFAHGLVSVPRTEGDIPGLFARHGFTTRRAGDTVVNTIQQLPDGSFLEIPADYWLIAAAE